MMLFDKKVLLGILGGFVLGKSGDMIFGSDTARKYYVKAATAGMIAKDCAMEKFETMQAAALDIADEAREEADKYQAKKDEDYTALQEEENTVADDTPVNVEA